MQSRGARTVEDVGRGIGVPGNMLHRWNRIYSSQIGKAAPLRDAEQEDVEGMRRRLRELEQENTLLKKAAALFAREVK